MKNEPNINGVTLPRITATMNNYERVINWYTRRYLSEPMPASVEKKYNAMLSVWQTLKYKRDELKTIIFKNSQQ